MSNPSVRKTIDATIIPIVTELATEASTTLIKFFHITLSNLRRNL